MAVTIDQCRRVVDIQQKIEIINEVIIKHIPDEKDSRKFKIAVKYMEKERDKLLHKKTP